MGPGQKYYNARTMRWETAGDLGLAPGFGGIERTRDIYSRLPDADIAGAIGPGVVPGGEQTVSKRRLIMDAADHPVPPTMRPLGGAQQNNRGQSILVDMVGDSLDHTIDVGSIVETPRDGGDDAESITVTCGVTLTPGFDAATFFNDKLTIRGTVEWGIGGSFFSADFDWLNGTSFSVVASFVRVKASVVYNIDADKVLTLSAGLGYGNSPVLNASPARLTIPAGIITAGATDVLREVPDFASALAIASAAMSGAVFITPPNWLIIFAGPNLQFAAYRWTDNSNQSQLADGTIPIPGWATHYACSNLSPDDQQLHCIFSLTL